MEYLIEIEDISQAMYLTNMVEEYDNIHDVYDRLLDLHTLLIEYSENDDLMSFTTSMPLRNDIEVLPYGRYVIFKTEEMVVYFEKRNLYN